MIDRINTQVAISVDNATKRAADALQRVTDRLAGKPDNITDRGVSLRLSTQYNENYIQARNAQDSISYLQTRDGALGSVTDSLQQLRDLAVRMGDPILNASDKGIIMQQANSIMQSIDQTAGSSEFNTHKVIGDISLSSLGLSGLNFGARGTIDTIDKALSYVGTKRAETGANITALAARIDNLANSSINLARAIDSNSGSLIGDIVNLSQSVNHALITYKAADVVLDLDREKVKGLLDMM